MANLNEMWKKFYITPEISGAVSSEGRSRAYFRVTSHKPKDNYISYKGRKQTQNLRESIAECFKSHYAKEIEEFDTELANINDEIQSLIAQKEVLSKRYEAEDLKRKQKFINRVETDYPEILIGE